VVKRFSITVSGTGVKWYISCIHLALGSAWAATVNGIKLLSFKAVYDTKIINKTDWPEDEAFSVAPTGESWWDAILRYLAVAYRV
jgi:hypothetical protein